MRQALSGLVVVELDQAVAGSYCGKLFADLGAHVVKVERPSGDPTRRLVDGATGAIRHGLSLHLHTNKQSVVLDPGADDTNDRLTRLLADADVVIEGTGDGSLEAWGTDAETVRRRSPRTTVVQLSPFGADGPYARYKGDDLIVQAMSGTMLPMGDGEPLRLPGRLSSYFTGHVAALGALASVLWSERFGSGNVVDCAAVEALATMPIRATYLLAYHYRGQVPRPVSGSIAGDTLIPTGVFPCADGYLAMMSTPQQLEEMLSVLDDDDLRAAFARPDAFERGETKEVLDAALYPWLFSHTRAEATAAAQAAGWPLAGVNEPREVLEADHLHQRGFWVRTFDQRVGDVDLPGPPARYGEGGWSLRGLAPDLGASDGVPPAEPVRGGALAPAAVSGPGAPAGALPLDGIRVVDLTTVWAGPYATMLLADLGAEVIRVENPWVLPPTTKGYTARPSLSNPGELADNYGPAAPGRPDRPWNRHAMNNCIGRNKLSCSLDNRRPEGRELLMRLVERSDVFIENFKASGLTNMGIGVSELMARNPRLIVLRMPPAGLAGDWSGYTGFGAQFDGLTGMTWLVGHRGADPTQSPATTYMDAASGPAAAFAVLAALRYRRETGRGQLVELPQAENVLNHLGDILVDCQLGIEPSRVGNRHDSRAPQGLYRCREGRWLAISVGDDEEWTALAKAIGRPELADDPRFADARSRFRHHDELDEALTRWAETQEAFEAFGRLQGQGVPASPILDDDAFCQDPHLVARRWMRDLVTRDVGTHPHPGHPYRGVPQAWRRGSPALGEDNEYVYKQILGVSDTDYERLATEKLLAEDYLDPTGNPW
jgi:crotonobetainyl-CoA:carnitine CoA-transferase CaiB-like acyl-CoA transferase